MVVKVRQHTIVAPGTARMLANATVGAMAFGNAGPHFEVPECSGGDCSSFYIPAPPVQGQGQTQQGQGQSQGHTEEQKVEPEPETATGGAGARQGNGRSGKQERLRELGKDDKVSSADRGEIKRDQ